MSHYFIIVTILAYFSLGFFISSPPPNIMVNVIYHNLIHCKPFNLLLSL